MPPIPLSRRAITLAVGLFLVTCPVAAEGPKPLMKCARDSAVAGTVCMDTYEASVWRVALPATANKGLVKKIQQGKATIGDLAKGGAVQLGTASDDYAPCADGGQRCVDDIYAVSIAGVTPSAYVTWFQAQQACRNARKRLPSNAEWQAAVAGTPDPGTDDGATACNTESTFVVAPTGSRSACVSADGVFDMIGNLYEWVSDWVPRSIACGAWSAGVSATGDELCLGGAADSGEPGALVRGGSFFYRFAAGPLTTSGGYEPSVDILDIGFRCAR